MAVTLYALGRFTNINKHLCTIDLATPDGYSLRRSEFARHMAINSFGMP